MRPPKPYINAGSVRFERLEELANRKEKADLYSARISLIGTDPITDELRENEEVELRVHQLCEEAWGEDPLWHNEESRPDSNYSVGVDDDKITVWDLVNGDSRTFAREDLDDPDFDIAEIFASPMSVREGEYPPLKKYQRCEWPAMNWLHARLTSQLEHVDKGNAPDDVKPENRIDVQPSMFGYSMRLDESDIIYNLMHKEILDRDFSPERVIDQISSARQVLAEDRGERFLDKRFSDHVTIMLGMTRIPRQSANVKRRGNNKRAIQPEGMPAIERNSPRVQDKTRRLPEPIVIQIEINGYPV